jgi:hypothetical protein
MDWGNWNSDGYCKIHGNLLNFVHISIFILNKNINTEVLIHMSDKRYGVILNFPRIQIVTLLVTQISPAYSYYLRLAYKHVPQHLLLRHPQSIALPQYVTRSPAPHGKTGNIILCTYSTIRVP